MGKKKTDWKSKVWGFFRLTKGKVIFTTILVCLVILSGILIRNFFQDCPDRCIEDECYPTCDYGSFSFIFYFNDLMEIPFSILLLISGIFNLNLNIIENNNIFLYIYYTIAYYILICFVIGLKRFKKKRKNKISKPEKNKKVVIISLFFIFYFAANVNALTDSNTTNIDVNNLSVLYEDSALKIFEFKIKNNANDTLTNINWSLNTGIETIYAKQLINLTQNTDIFVLFSYNYTPTGDYTVTATATDSINQDSDSISIDIEDIGAGNLTGLYNSSRERIFEFFITNQLTSTLTNVSWQFDTKNGLMINSTENIILTPGETIFNYIKYNFTSAGTYNVNATAINGSLKDSANLTITIT